MDAKDKQRPQQERLSQSDVGFHTVDMDQLMQSQRMQDSLEESRNTLMVSLQLQKQSVLESRKRQTFSSHQVNSDNIRDTLNTA